MLITQLGVLAPDRVAGYGLCANLEASLVALPSAIRTELTRAVDAGSSSLGAEKAMGSNPDESRQLLLLAGEEGYRLGRYLLRTHTMSYPDVGSGVGASQLVGRLAAWEVCTSSIAEHLGSEVVWAVETLACEVGAFESRALSWSGQKSKRIGQYGALIQSGIEIALAEFECQTAPDPGR